MVFLPSREEVEERSEDFVAITRIVWQHSEPLPAPTMEFLRGIAEDYRKVKNAVYERFSGIRSMNRLTPVFTVLNEMRACGLRAQLNLPVVYYELAVAEAVRDIKSMWGILKKRMREKISASEHLTADECMYLRTILRIDSTLAAILEGKPYDMPRKTEGLEVDAKRLNNLLRRWVRSSMKKPKTDRASAFRVTPAGFRYKDGGVYLVSRVPRQRVYIPLRDAAPTKRQIQICLAEDRVSIAVPLDTEPVEHEDYDNTIYAYIGYRDAITLSNGHVYGKDLNRMVSPETERLNSKNRERAKLLHAYEKSMEEGNPGKAERVRANNLGRKKYLAQKQRVRERTQNFINGEINRMIASEKPGRIVITRPVLKNRTKYRAKGVNRKLARSFGGYIRQRLAYKCSLHGIELVAINSKGTGNICSACGAEGIREQQDFHCGNCGYTSAVAVNSARNIERLYMPYLGIKDEPSF